MNDPKSEVTQLLTACCNGDQAALEQLAPIVESELPRLARGYPTKEPGVPGISALEEPSP